jgi:hypothetical protein
MQVVQYLRSSSHWISNDIVIGIAGVDAVVVVGLLLFPKSTDKVVQDTSDVGTTLGSTTLQSRSPYKMVLTL